MNGKIVKKIKTFILWILTPIQKILQRLGRQESRITRSQVDSILLLAEHGDIFLSYEQGRPTSFFIKGKYDHAAMLSSKFTIVEAVGDYHGGVREVDLEEWLFKKDSVAIIRPLYFDKTINKIAAANSLYYVGKKYDYTFQRGNERLYCSELPYVCYRTEDDYFMSHISVDDEILPQEYYKMSQMTLDFELIYEVINA